MERNRTGGWAPGRVPSRLSARAGAGGRAGSEPLEEGHGKHSRAQMPAPDRSKEVQLASAADQRSQSVKGDSNQVSHRRGGKRDQQVCLNSQCSIYINKIRLNGVRLSTHASICLSSAMLPSVSLVRPMPGPGYSTSQQQRAHPGPL